MLKMDVEVLKKELEKLTGQEWQKPKKYKFHTPPEDEVFMHSKKHEVYISLFKEMNTPVISFYSTDQKISYAPLVIDNITEIAMKKGTLIFYVNYLPEWSYAAAVRFS
jgi:hypothetical protein